jgi:hypothetical protein
LQETAATVAGSIANTIEANELNNGGNQEGIWQRQWAEWTTVQLGKDEGQHGTYLDRFETVRLVAGAYNAIWGLFSGAFLALALVFCLSN